MSFPVWLPGPMFFPGGYGVTSSLATWSHVPSIGSLSRKRPPGTDIYLVVTAAVLGTHLTGMHSCWICD